MQSDAIRFAEEDEEQQPTDTIALGDRVCHQRDSGCALTKATEPIEAAHIAGFTFGHKPARRLPFHPGVSRVTACATSEIVDAY
jgi:hypothetical protein